VIQVSERPSFVGPMVESEWGRFLLRYKDGSEEELRALVAREVKERFGVDAEVTEVVLRSFTSGTLDVLVHARQLTTYERVFSNATVV
jgi:hypothetical protein